MKIKLDDNHYLISDKHCCFINETIPSKRGKVYEKRVSGYCTDVLQAILSFVDISIMESKSNDLSELTQEIKALKKEVEGWKDKLCEQSSKGTA